MMKSDKSTNFKAINGTFMIIVILFDAYVN